MFGLSIEKLLMIGLLAALVLGPERLPGYAARLGRFVRGIRSQIPAVKERIKEELGPEATEIDLRDLDPRKYDPRRIVREALLEDPAPTRRASAPPPGPSSLEGEPPYGGR